MRQVYEHHPVVGFRFIPGVKARLPHEGGGYLVRTNSTGFRDDREFAAARTPGVKRVLVFGDSFTAGEGVSNGKRWTDELERLIPGVEFYNFGLPATGTDQHYLICREFARGIEHDLLLIAVYVENIRRVGSKYRWFQDDRGRRVLYAKPYFELEDGKLALRGVPVPAAPIDAATLDPGAAASIAATARFPRLKRAFTSLRRHPAFERAVVKSGLKDRFMRMAGYRPLPEYDTPERGAWPVMRAVIREWIAGHDGPAAVVPIPLPQYVEGLASPGAYQERLREAAESAGGSFIDPLGALAASPPSERRGFYFPGDGHMTVEGNAALARALAPALRAKLEGGAGA